MKFCFAFILFTLILFGMSPAFAGEPLFPQVTEVSPAPGTSCVDSNSPVVLEFSLEMDRKSVEGCFRIIPHVPGRFSWDKNRMEFHPTAPLPASTRHVVTLTPEIKGSEGMPLPLTWFTTSAQALYEDGNGTILMVNLNGEKIPLVKGNNPVWGKANRAVFFDGSGKIWAKGVFRKTPQCLSPDFPLQAEKPRYNHHTDVIAFVASNDAGVSNIYTLNGDTGIINQLTAFFDPVPIDSVRWSGDGLYLAFSRKGQIWIVGKADSGLKRLTTDEIGCQGGFVWSPSGTKIAFIGKTHVWVGDIYSLNLKKVGFCEAETRTIDWSRENKLIFEARGVVMMNADGSDEKVIATGARNPIWLGEGEYFSCVLPLRKDNLAQLWIMSADGYHKRPIGAISSDKPFVAWSLTGSREQDFTCAAGEREGSAKNSGI